MPTVTDLVNTRRAVRTTRIDLPLPARMQAVAVLNEVLARTLDLGLQARHAHWNIVGANFASVHQALGRLVADLDRMSDDVAERAVQLGGMAEGALRAIDSHGGCAVGSGEHDCLKLLAGALAETAAGIRRAISEVAPLNDPVTTDILTAAARDLEKWLWYMEAHMPEYA